MKEQLGRVGAFWTWIREGIRAHPFFTSCVVYLVLKQMLVLWTFLERPYAPPNMLIALSGAALFTLSWAFALHGRLRLLALASVDLAFGAILLVDIVYFRQFADLPSVASLRYAGLAVEMDTAVESLLHPVDALLFVGPAILLGVALVRGEWLARQRAFTVRRVAALSLVGVGLVAAVTLTTGRLKKPFGGHTIVASRLGPIGYHAYDAGTFVSRALRKRFVSIEEELAEARAFFAARPKAPPGELHGRFAGRNVIYVQLESWQAFATEIEVGGEPVTPHFRALAQESLHFTDFHAQIGQGTTSDAELGAQCSLYASRTGSVYYENASNDLRCLPEILREAGYTTVAMHANRPDFWNRAAMYPAVGVGTFYDERAFDFEPEEEIGWGLGDVDFFEQVVDKLAALPRPFYALVISITSHAPFDFENLPRELDHGRFADTRVAHYLDTVRYTDRALGRLVERLRETGILDKSILVVYGDHQGVAKDSSNVGEFLGLADANAATWFDVERRVPALVRLPGGVAAGVRQEAAGQLDIAPTVAGLLGLDVSTAPFFGRDLLSSAPAFVGLPNGSALDDELLHLTADGGHGKAGCFDRASGAQVPGERCAALAERVATELDIAWGIVQLDLVAKVAGEAGGGALTQL